MDTTDPPSPTPHIAKTLLTRLNSPDLAASIFTESILRKPVYLRKTSSADQPANQRDARRRAKAARDEQKRRRKYPKPTPLSAKDKRALSVHIIPEEQRRWKVFLPLHALWLGYARDILGIDRLALPPHTLDIQSTSSALASGDWHGCMVEVVRCRCVGRVGIRGIIARETRGTLEIITRGNGLKVVPKEFTMLRVEVSTEGDLVEWGSEGNLVFEVVGDRVVSRPGERATRKFKFHLPVDL